MTDNLGIVIITIIVAVPLLIILIYFRIKNN
jgi:hypothetical protein